MTDDQLQVSADFYGIDIAEARLRHELCMAQGDNPDDPICIGCARRPHEIPEYIFACMESEDDEMPSAVRVREYVIQEEGTYNRTNGHFLCDECYIRNGQPSSARGWVCP